MEDSWMFYLIIWALCAWGSMTIVKNKGYTKSKQTVWAVLGALFGVFAILITLFLPKKTDGFVESGEMIICPSCKKAIPFDSVKCRYCRSVIE